MGDPAAGPELKERISKSFAWKPGDLCELERLPGGANNKVYRASVAGDLFVVKEYFRGANDARSRGPADFGFSKFLWDNGIRSLPQPFAYDAQEGFGLFAYIDGRKLASDEVRTPAVEAAAAFFDSINRIDRAVKTRSGLADASEACFSIAQHVATIERRTKILDEAARNDRSAEFAELVLNELLPHSIKIKSQVLRGAETSAFDVESLLADEERCLSPSDFGFHNALLDESGTLRFLDFEYSGWDDPAKMACDFFWQPEIPVGREHFDAFCEKTMSSFPSPGPARRRAEILLPLYGIKWCCIILNEFLPAASSRREFARGEDVERYRAGQLSKARAVLERVSGSTNL